MSQQQQQQQQQSNVSATVSTLIDTGSTRLTDWNTKITAQDTQYEQSLLRIADVDQVLKTEKDRLLAKKKEVDQAYETQTRLLSAQESETFRTRAYIYIALTLIIACILIIGMQMIRQLAPSWFEPVSFFVNLGIGTITLLVIAYFLNDVQRRSYIDHTQLNLMPPDGLKRTRQDYDKQLQQGDQLGAAQACANGECCDPATTQFVPYLGKCVNRSSDISKDFLYNVKTLTWEAAPAATNTQYKSCHGAIIPKTDACNDSFTTLDSVAWLPFNIINDDLALFSRQKWYSTVA